MELIIGIVIVGIFIYVVIVLSIKLISYFINLFKSSESSTAQSKFIVTGSDFYCDNENVMSNVHFYGNDESVVLFGETLDCPLVYCCDLNRNSTRIPFLINLKLQVSFSNRKSHLGYYPSYHYMSPTQRGQFLNWLKGGKKDQDIDIGYVFVYFYGLEYRAAVENKDKKLILFELIRLYKTYAWKSQSFGRYIFNLICYIIFSIKGFSEEDKKELIAFVQKTEFSNPYLNSKKSVLYHLDNSLINSFKADEYVLSELNYQHKQPITAHYNKEDVFKAYLSLLIKEKSNIFNVQKQTYEYYSSHYYSYSWDKKISYQKVVVSRELKDLSDKAYSDLKKYVTSVTRKNSHGTFSRIPKTERYNYFPDMLKEYFAHPKVKQLTGLLKNQEYAVVSVKKMFKILGIVIEGNIALKKSSLLSESMESAGYSVEPDPRLLRKKYKEDEKVAFYMPEEKYTLVDMVQEDVELYHLTRTLVDVGISISAIDNYICDKEIGCMLNFVSDRFKVSNKIKERLKYRMLLGREQQIDVSGLLKILSREHDEESLKVIGKFFVCIAAADGKITVDELELVKRYFRELGLPEEYFGNLLKGLAVNKEDPVVIQISRGETKIGSKIPKGPKQKVASNYKVILDKVKIDSILDDTTQVQKVLNDVFSDETDSFIEEKNVISTNDPFESVLDIKLNQLISILIKKSDWSKEDVKLKCTELDLMVNAAIDKINEWAEESYGDFLIEDEGSACSINQDVLLLMNKEELENV